MRALTLILCLATPAAAQTVFDRAPGLYGSATDPFQSCDANPHELSFTGRPNHLILRWTVPRSDADGQMSAQDTYDLRDATDSTLLMQREGDARLPETGQRPMWIFRLTSEGYCMGRSDWPLPRCVNAAIRCGNDAPTS